jgi:hypothetical protein
LEQTSPYLSRQVKVTPWGPHFLCRHLSAVYLLGGLFVNNVESHDRDVANWTPSQHKKSNVSHKFFVRFGTNPTPIT